MQNGLPVSTTSELTEREREILKLLATGTSNKDIAQQLFISSNTVKVHLRNIFAKIGAASRTEAAVYAIHEGISQPIGSPVDEPAVVPAHVDTKIKPPVLWISILVTVLLAGAATLVWMRFQTPKISAAVPAPVVAPQRWHELATMPTARSGLAVAVYENQIYAIGGETAQGVTGVMEQYDLATDKWLTLIPKPVAVTEINAAVIRGLIYVPGGRLATGDETNILEAYDPNRSQWKRLTSLPVALSGYALTAFEGNMYVFGGWDGHNYLNSVYEYEPSLDKWTKRWPMPTARAYASAALAGGNIYVIGGRAGSKALAVNEEYAPANDTADENPWILRADIPEARYAMGIASIADIIHVVGGSGAAPQLHAYIYFPQKDEWQSFEFPVSGQLRGLGVGVLETRLHIFGGVFGSATAPSGQHLVYQAIYTLFIPVIK